MYILTSKNATPVSSSSSKEYMMTYKFKNTENTLAPWATNRYPLTEHTAEMGDFSSMVVIFLNL